MKTNSTFKFLRNLLLLVVGVLGFAVSGVGQTYEVGGYTENVTITYYQDSTEIFLIVFHNTLLFASGIYI